MPLALVALKEGFFSQGLSGRPGRSSRTAFSSGTQETTALLAGQLDAAYVGPEPGHQRVAEAKRHL